MPDQNRWMKRQQVLADFGDFAIRSEDLDEVLTEACRLVGEALGTGRAKVLEIQEGREELLVRAGVGWAPDVVGTVRLQMRDRSSETYAIEAAAPVVSQDIASETRFDIPDFMKKAGVVAMVNVPIFVPGQRPYGVLQVDDTKPRAFGDDEIQFLRTYAMILGPVIDRLHLVEERADIRERLSASEVRHRLLVESWAQAVWEVDADGVMVSDSPSWRAYTGQTLEQFRGYGWLAAIHPEDRDGAERQWREAVADGRSVSLEYRLRAPGGGWRWTNVRAAPVLDEAGRVKKWAGMNIDIDDRKRAEQALRESEELRGLALQSGGMGAWRWDTRERCVWADESFQKLWGVSFGDRPHPVSTYIDRMDPAGARALEAVMTLDIAPGQELQDQVQVTQGATSGHWVQWRGCAEQDRPWIINGVSFDITEQRVAEQRLRQSEERLRSAVEVGRLGLWDWDVITGKVHWSDEHFRMEGYAVGEVVPSYENWAARIHPDDRPGAEAALQQAIARREEFAREFRVIHPDQSVHGLSARGKFFHDDSGRPIRMVGAMVETTERREWEDRQQVLIAELQHRTRNLMGVVRSMADNTARASRSLVDFRARFRDRLEALSRVQGLLSRLNDHDRVAFDELIETEFSALGSGTDRVRLEGPRGVRLRSSTVQTLAMALHELATNAMKYGALGQADAQLAVTWRTQVDDVNGRPWLYIDWRESGVDMPASGSRPIGGGQGRELIEKALPYQLSARTSYELGPDGVHCTISIPISTAPAQKIVEI